MEAPFDAPFYGPLHGPMEGTIEAPFEGINAGDRPLQSFEVYSEHSFAMPIEMILFA